MKIDYIKKIEKEDFKDRKILESSFLNYFEIETNINNLSKNETIIN